MLSFFPVFLVLAYEQIEYSKSGHQTKSNEKIVETEAKPIPLTHINMTPNTHIHDP
jgi:hypothetical protein